MNVKKTFSFRNRGINWSLFLTLVLIAAVTVFIPAWLIMPFKAQSASGVALSYFLKSMSPVVTALALLSAIALGVRIWSLERLIGRVMLIPALLVVTVSFWFARQNHFEWMFNPLPNPGFATAGEAGFIKDSDMVMAVALNGESAAYPVRQMAYHHLVQDRVGAVDLVATY